MAPEILENHAYTYKSDVWSVGTILFELLTGFSPFKESKNKEQLKINLKKKKIFPTELTISEECLSLINKCLNYDSELRPSWD